MDKATPDSVMALATDLWHADGGEPFRIKRNELRAEVERLAAQSAPTEPVVTKDQRELIAKLRYMGKQYAAGQFARGGVPQKHYLEEAADEIEMMAWALNMNEKTPGSAQENADLRNVIQAACIDGIPGLERAWAKYFPGKPITVSPGAVAQSAPTEEMSPEFTDTARAALLWVLWHHQGASSKVGQPIRFALGMDQYQPLSEYQVREAKRWAALNPTRDAANVPPGEWQNEGEGLTPKQAWWAGYRVGKGLPPDMPRSEAVAQSAPLAQQAREYPPLPEPIPPNVFWARLADNFYSADGRGMGEEFYSKWEPRSAEFPQGEAWGWGKSAHNPFKDADRAAAQVEPVRMLTEDELHECCGGCTSNAAIKTWMRYAITWFCKVNAGKRIPADGEVRNG